MKGRRRVELCQESGRATVSVTLPGGRQSWTYENVTPASKRRFLQVMNSWIVSNLLFKEQGWVCTVQPPEALARATLPGGERRERMLRPERPARRR